MRAVAGGIDALVATARAPVWADTVPGNASLAIAAGLAASAAVVAAGL
jgi:hypothetical protein